MSRPTWTLAIIFAVGCNQSDFGTDPNGPNPDGPGTPQWGDVNVTCSADSDCNFGESCTNNICQMQRCGQTYTSKAPLGTRRLLVSDRDLVVADGTAARGFLSTGTSVASSSMWTAGSETVTDVAGGALLPDGAELAVVLRANNPSMYVPKNNIYMGLPFVPISIAAGDIDNDGMDEAIALGANGEVSICNVDTTACANYNFPSGTTGYEVAAGDVDGDGIDEVVFHLGVNGSRYVRVWNVDAGITGQPDVMQVSSPSLIGLTVADTNGDGRAEIYGLEDGGYFGFASDKIHEFAVTGTSVSAVADTSVSGNSIDIAGGDLDRDKHAELILLGDDKVVHIYEGTGTSLTLNYAAPLSTASSPTHIAAIDFDGDSTVGKLTGAAQLVAGEVVPTTVMYMPPYYESMSKDRPWVMVGNGTTHGESRTDSVGLSVGATIGYEGEIPGIVEGEVNLSLEKEAEYSHTFEKEITITDRFQVQADPTLYGTDNAAVVLACGCYHQYTYQLASPAVGGDGSKLVVMVPVGGQSLMWSSKRYNAMAKAVGNMPIVTVPMRTGDARSYPTTPERQDGSPIPADDLVFTSTPTTRVSDVAAIEWELDTTNTHTNGQSMTTTVSMDASLTVVGVKLGVMAGLSWAQGYEVSVGSTVELGGTVPALPDNPKTPEDEYVTYQYGFQPVVYRQPYKDKTGANAAYYVVNYAVAF